MNPHVVLQHHCINPRRNLQTLESEHASQPQKSTQILTTTGPSLARSRLETSPRFWVNETRSVEAFRQTTLNRPRVTVDLSNKQCCDVTQEHRLELRDTAEEIYKLQGQHSLHMFLERMLDLREPNVQTMDAHGMLLTSN